MESKRERGFGGRRERERERVRKKEGEFGWKGEDGRVSWQRGD